MKQIYLFLLALLVLLGYSTGANAYDFSSPSLGQEPIDLYYSINPDGKTVTLTYGTVAYASNVDVEIPATVTHDGTEYTVTIIGYQAFQRTYVKSVTMPNTIEEVQSYAFDHSSVTLVNFSSSLKNIREYAFNGTEMRKVDLPDGLETIGKYAFADHTVMGDGVIDSIYVPNSVTEIGERAFMQQGKLRYIHMPENLEVIKIRTFENCGNLKTIDLPKKLKTIEEWAFASSGLTDISFPTSLEMIGERAFSGCSSLSKVVLPNNVTTIEDCAFYGCHGLTSITFSAGMRKIPQYVCSYCTKLVEVNIPEGIEYIDIGAFDHCTMLSGISFPESVISTGEFVLAYTAITSFEFPSKMDTLKSQFFDNCKSLAEIDIPSTIKCIERYVFDDCSNLKRVTLPEGIEKIAEGLFDGCTSLESVNIPESVTAIDGSSFYRCEALKTIQMPANLQSIGSAFGYSGITEITFPSTLESIGGGCFSECRSLTAVHINRGIPPRIMGSQIIHIDNKTTLYVPIGSKAAYEAISPYAAFAQIVEEDVPGDVYYKVSVTRSAGSGQVQIGSSEAYYEADETILRGERVVISLIPGDGYELGQLLCNGTDVTDEVVNNTYTVEELLENLSFSVSYKRSPLVMSLKSGNGGSIDIKVEYEKDFTCFFVPEEGYSINAVYLNGSDVTYMVGDDYSYTVRSPRMNYILSVSFENTSGISNATMPGKQRIVAYATGDGSMSITGAEPGEAISIYNEAGVLQRSLTADGNTISVTLPENHVYIVKTSSKTIKIGL